MILSLYFIFLVIKETKTIVTAEANMPMPVAFSPKAGICENTAPTIIPHLAPHGVTLLLHFDMLIFSSLRSFHKSPIINNGTNAAPHTEYALANKEMIELE